MGMGAGNNIVSGAHLVEAEDFSIAGFNTASRAPPSMLTRVAQFRPSSTTIARTYR